MAIDGDRRLMTPQHYNPRLRAFIDATEHLLGVPTDGRAQMEAAGLMPGLVADLYRYDMTELTQNMWERQRAWLSRANRFDLLTHRRLMKRFSKAVWRLRRYFPTATPKIWTNYGRQSIETAFFRAMQQRFWGMFKTGELSGPEPREQWINPGTVDALCDLFELAFLFSRNPDVMVGYDAWHPLRDNEETFDEALAEFILVTGKLLKRR